MFKWLKSEYAKSLERQLEENKTSHAKELDYVKSELAWHKEEVERLRRFLIPTMQPAYDQVRAANSPEPPASVVDKYAGLTPFQRLQARDLEQQDEELAEQKRIRAAKAQAEAPKPAN